MSKYILCYILNWNMSSITTILHRCFGRADVDGHTSDNVSICLNVCCTVFTATSFVFQFLSVLITPLKIVFHHYSLWSWLDLSELPTIFFSVNVTVVKNASIEITLMHNLLRVCTNNKLFNCQQDDSNVVSN